MTRHGAPIRTARARDTVNPGIGYSLLYEEWDACVECGLDLEKWYENEYDIGFKHMVVAFNRCRKMVELHTMDAVNHVKGK